ncbi:MAG: glycosyltransferase family 2 protein, partial [Acidimicrobiia bacterium]
TTAGLAQALRRLIAEPGLANELASRPVPDLGDPWAAYARDPEPRHPRSQAGLATAAMKGVEAVMRGKARHIKPLQRTYRFLPAPLARAGARLTPRWIKDRLRSFASWPAEEARRAREARLGRVVSRMAAGEFPELESPEVTVVIPVYNEVRFLEETLASVYEQDYDSWEIVVVDDGSTDPEAVAFLDSLEARPRLRLVRQDNRGLPGARNAGIAVGRGRYVVPLDSDDELDPRYLERMVAALEAEPEAGYAHCYARLYHDIDAYWITRPYNPYWQLIENGVVGCVLLRREAWQQVGGYDETMTAGNEDWELWIRLLEAGWSQVQVPEVLFRYRKHGVSMSVDTEARFEEGRRAVRDRHPELYGSLGEWKARWYPLVTVVADTPVEGVDIETVGTTEELASSWGKYVVDARGVEVSAEVLMVLAEALEENPEAARARTAGTPPLVMVRRWNLHDPEASPTGEVVVDHPQAGPETSLPEHVEREGWTVPKGLEEPIPVQRQRPEEPGSLPDPPTW